MSEHPHCWHAMDGSTPEEHFYACCWGGCEDVMAAGRREFEEKSHGPIGWTPGRVLRPELRPRGVSVFHAVMADMQRIDDDMAAEVEFRRRNIVRLPGEPMHDATSDDEPSR